MKLGEGWNCACDLPDAWECMRRRYKDSFLAKAPFGDDDYCECSCHEKDEDGWTKWDHLDQLEDLKP